MSMFGLSIAGLLLASRKIRKSMGASCISDVCRRRRLRAAAGRRRAGRRGRRRDWLRADHFYDSLRERVWDWDRQVVVRDLPLAVDLAQHAAAAAFAVRGAVELLVEPGHVAGWRDDHVAVARRE